jgi:hypothetical protein
MSEVLTIAQIEAQFEPEWVLLEDPRTDEGLEVHSGTMRRHSKDREEVYRRAVQMRPRMCGCWTSRPRPGRSPRDSGQRHHSPQGGDGCRPHRRRGGAQHGFPGNLELRAPRERRDSQSGSEDLSTARLGLSSDLHAGRTAGRVAVSKDSIVEEVRRVREAQAAKHSFNVKEILAAAKKRQRRSKHKVVSFLPKKMSA